MFRQSFLRTASNMLPSCLLSSCSLTCGSTLGRIATCCQMQEVNAPAIIVSAMQVAQLAYVGKVCSAFESESFDFFSMCWFGNAGCLLCHTHVHCTCMYMYFQQDFYKWCAYNCVSVQFVGTVKPVYMLDSHPWNLTNWLLYRGGLLIEIALKIS